MPFTGHEITGTGRIQDAGAAPPLDKKHKVVWIDGVWYGVTEFAALHPGGSVICKWVGKDCTDAFHAFHATSKRARLILRGLRKVEAPQHALPEVPAVTKDFRLLQSRLLRDGWFEASPWRTARDIGVCSFLYLLGVWLGVAGKTAAVQAVGAFTMGLTITFNGWTMHYAGHGGLAKSRSVNLLIQDALLTCTVGFSSAWWRSRHNKHHAAPNHEKNDPDLRTLPILCWHEKLAHPVAKGNRCAALAWQRSLFVPYLFLYMFVFRVSSYMHVYRQRDAHAAACLALHWVSLWALSWAVGHWTFWTWWFWLANAVAGVCLGCVFAVSHFPKELVHEGQHLDWVTAQAITTQNFRCNWLMHYATGCMGYQLEHHLFPQMPSHRYVEVAPEVKALCQKHGVPYFSVSWREALASVFSHMVVV